MKINNSEEIFCLSWWWSHPIIWSSKLLLIFALFFSYRRFWYNWRAIKDITQVSHKVCHDTFFVMLDFLFMQLHMNNITQALFQIKIFIIGLLIITVIVETLAHNMQIYHNTPLMLFFYYMVLFFANINNIKARVNRCTWLLTNALFYVKLEHTWNEACHMSSAFILHSRNYIVPFFCAPEILSRQCIQLISFILSSLFCFILMF